MTPDVSENLLDKRHNELIQEAKKSGYNLNPDTVFTRGLVEGLLINANRYGYESCPCRLSLGDKEFDLDIICPCDYRDDDLSEYGACFCGLYVSDTIASENLPAPVVPERRPLASERMKKSSSSVPAGGLPFPVYRCKVCGYLCARNNPPEKCPICKAVKERFEIFLR